MPSTDDHKTDTDRGADRAVPAVSFVAPSGTGKTTLISAVIERLSALGLQVGAVKHDAHRIELDTEGKDSWRFRQAGAAETLLVGVDQTAWMSARDASPTLTELLPLLRGRVDIIIVEGFRSAGLPTVIVQRPDITDSHWQEPTESSVLARLHPADIDAAVRLLIATFDLPVSEA